MIYSPESILKQIIGSPGLTPDEKNTALENYPTSLPERFWLLMTVGQSFTEQGPPRVKFYEADRTSRRQVSCCIPVLFYSQSNQLSRCGTRDRETEITSWHLLKSACPMVFCFNSI